MKEISFIPEKGEKLLFQTHRRPEWSMIIPCLFSVPVLLALLWGAKPLVWAIGSIIALMILFYAIRLILCAFHDWVVLTDKRIIWCTYSIPFFHEIRKTCLVEDVVSYRQYQSLHSSRKKKNKGELELKLKNGKHFSLPTLIGMGDFLAAFSKLHESPQTENEEAHNEQSSSGQ